jgi:hypothetical protein
MRVISVEESDTGCFHGHKPTDSLTDEDFLCKHKHSWPEQKNPGLQLFSQCPRRQ